MNVNVANTLKQGSEYLAVADPRRAPDVRTPSIQIYHFHAAFGKNFAK